MIGNECMRRGGPALSRTASSHGAHSWSVLHTGLGRRHQHGVDQVHGRVGGLDAGVVCGGVKTANATVYLIDTVLMPPAKPGYVSPTTNVAPCDEAVRLSAGPPRRMGTHYQSMTLSHNGVRTDLGYEVQI